MGVAVGLILIAFGAILTWAVDATVSGLNVTAIGVILLVLGIVVVLLDFFWWRSWEWYAAGPGPARRRRTYVHDTATAPAAPVQPVAPAQQPYAPAGRRRVVVDEEEAGPAPGPPPPP